MLECNSQPALQINGAAAGIEWRGALWTIDALLRDFSRRLQASIVMVVCVVKYHYTFNQGFRFTFHVKVVIYICYMAKKNTTVAEHIQKI